MTNVYSGTTAKTILTDEMVNLVTIENDKPMTTSLKVAEVFGKMHRHVLDAIDALIERGVPNFRQTLYTHPQNGQKYRRCLMDRDGFSLLVMGFTGDKALSWKLKFIAAFNAMEAALRERHTPKPMTTSLKVAEVFGKRHDNVLADIDNLIERGVLNFEETLYTHPQPVLRDIDLQIERGVPNFGETINAIVPVRHEEVTVLDSTVLVAVNEEGRGFFSPRHVCDALGITWQGQRVKIMADPVLSTTVTEIVTMRPDGSRIPAIMLPIEFLSGWLFTIKKVAPAIQGKLDRFRLEGCFALDAWFRQGLRNNPVVKEVVQVPMSYKEALYELIRREEENEPWFVAKDVCEALGLRTDNIPAILDEDEFAKVDPYTIGVALTVPNGITLLSESGLFSFQPQINPQEGKLP